MRAFCTNEELKIYLTEIFLIYKRGHMWHKLVATLVTNRILDPLHYLRDERMRKEKQL